MKSALTITTGFFLGILVVASVVLWSSSQLGWYEQTFVRLGITQQFPATRLHLQTQNLLAYVSGAGALDETFYTAREVSHLKDVAALYRGLRFTARTSVIALILLCVGVLKMWGKRELVRTLSSASLVWLAILLVAGLGWTLWFMVWFTGLHLLLFRNDLWLLDPAVDQLVNIFPPELFQLLARNILAGINLTFLLVWLGGQFALRLQAGGSPRGPWRQRQP